MPKYLADSRKVANTAHTGSTTKTLKLPFLRLNCVKADEFARLQALNTSTANAILAMPPGERRTLTSKSFAHVEIGSTWINQTIRMVLKAPADGAHGMPLNTVRDSTA